MAPPRRRIAWCRGDGGEKLVSREEAPVDVNSKSGPRVVFPPLNQNGSPPPVASVTTAAPPPATTANGTMPNSEPRKIKTLAVKGDAAENGGAPRRRSRGKTGGEAGAGRSAPPPRSLIPHRQRQRQRATVAVAAGRPAQPEPRRRRGRPPPTPHRPRGGGYVVQVSSQKNEADAQASYRALQGKYPSVLGSQSSAVKRVDLGEKGVYYRAFVGPFSSADRGDTGLR